MSHGFAKKLVFAAFIFTACSSVTFAAEQVSECYRKAKTTNDSELCAAAESHALEAQLNNIFEYTVTNGQEPDAVNALREAQVTWNNFREQDCHAVSYSYGSGTYRGTAFQECMAVHATRRIEDLKSWNPSHWTGASR